VNHSHTCQPNEAAIYDEAARVAILFAQKTQKDIKLGEEIFICHFAPFFWFVIPIESETYNDRAFVLNPSYFSVEYLYITCFKLDNSCIRLY